MPTQRQPLRNYSTKLSPQKKTIDKRSRLERIYDLKHSAYLLRMTPILKPSSSSSSAGRR